MKFGDDLYEQFLIWAIALFVVMFMLSEIATNLTAANNVRNIIGLCLMLALPLPLMVAYHYTQKGNDKEDE